MESDIASPLGTARPDDGGEVVILADLGERPVDQRRMAQFRIDDLAQEVGITVRTIRSYVTRGLLPPPTHVVGRTNWYDDEHVARLRLIAELLRRNYTLDSITELIHAQESGRDLEELLGLGTQLVTPWHEVAPIRLTRDQLIERFGFTDDDAREEGVAAGYLVPDGDEWIMAQPGLIDVAVALVKAGVPIRAVLELGITLQHHAAGIAEAFISMTERELWDPFEAAGMPSEQIPVLSQFLRDIRPLADAAVLAHLATAIDEVGPRVLERIAREVPDGGSKERSA